MVHTYQRSCLFSGDRLWPSKHSISYLHLTFSSSSQRISNPTQFHQSQTNIKCTHFTAHFDVFEYFVEDEKSSTFYCSLKLMFCEKDKKEEHILETPHLSEFQIFLFVKMKNV